MNQHQPEMHKPPGHESRIYVASLSDYNHGILHGTWIDADQEVEQLHEQVDAMLARSPTKRRLGEPAEEWAIHDYEGFGAIRLSEHSSLARVARLGRGIGDNGQAFTHWAAYVDDEHRLDEFEDVYLGEWRSVQEYGEHILDDLGYVDEIMEAVPDHLKAYVTIDGSAFSRDLVLSGDVYVSETRDGTVMLFDART